MDVLPSALIAVLAVPWVVAAGWVAYRLAAPPGRDGAVVPGKYTAELQPPFVVFVIGIHTSSSWFPWRWGVLADAGRAMRAMRKELEEEPEHGCLLVNYADSRLSNPTRLIQIWRSFDDLERYARSRMAAHLAKWMDWNSTAKTFPGGEIPGLGIYHETYVVSSYEAIYRNMPLTGLARARTVRVVSAAEGRRRTARGRLGEGDGDDAPTS